MLDLETDPPSEVVCARARLFDTASQAVIGTTSAGTIVYWSASAETLYGWSAAEAIGRDILDTTPSRLSRDAAADLMNHLRTGRVWSGQFAVQDRKGAEFSVFVRDLPVLDGLGKLVGVVGISTPLPGGAP